MIKFVEYAGGYVCAGCGIQLLPGRPQGATTQTAVAKLTHQVVAPHPGFPECQFNGKEGLITLKVQTAY